MLDHGETSRQGLPRKQGTRFSYERRVNAVLDAIMADIGREFTLEDMAAVACLSPFHLHRVFTAMMGETPAACIWRLRVQMAAYALQSREKKSVTDIALACGFSSSQNFARAFKAWAGVSPTRYRALHHAGQWAAYAEAQKRKEGNAAPYHLDYGVVHGEFTPRIEANDAILRKGADMNVIIEELPAYRLAYVRQIGPYGPQLMQAWGRLMGWAGPSGLLGPKSACVGISWDNPEMTPAERCRYDACLVIGEASPEPAGLEAHGVSLQTLPGGLHACYRRPTRMHEYAEAWNEIFGIWLPRSGYVCCGVPFEYYHPPLQCDDSPEAATDVSFCIPVKPE